MLHDGQSIRVAVIGGSRIPFCRSHSIYRDCSNKDMMTAALSGVVNKFDLKVQRACGTSLEACALIGNKIALGQIESGIAGGTDSISDSPIVYPDSYRSIMMDVFRARSLAQRILPWFRLRPSHFKPELPGVNEPRTGLSMGQSAEITAKEWDIPREHQDQLALSSHMKAAAAFDAGWYEDLVVPFMDCEEDNNIRRDTTFEKLSSLKPVFDRSEEGTMTAGNSTPLTDGAAAVLLASEEWARLKNLPISAYLTFTQTAAVNFVNDEGLLMAPAYAVSEMLKAADLTLQDFDFYEIHEAFASQTVATLKAWQSEKFCRERLGRNAPLGPIDLARLNVKGGSLAMGHPFAATGARIVGTMAKLLSEKGSGRGLISVCTAGGMGVSAIMEAA